MTDGVRTTSKVQELLWRDEFSISKANERYVSPRQLAKFLTLGSLGMFAGDVWILVRSWIHTAQAYQRSLVARVGEIPVGGVKLFQYPKPGEQCIMIRTAEDSYVAYTRAISLFRMARCSKERPPDPYREFCWNVKVLD
jgi:hypothetical protein